MELRPLCVMFLLTELILCTQTGDLENPKPVVIIKPDKQVFSGETVTFKCEINSTKVTKWTYSLYKYNDTENSYNETQEFIISSVTVSNSGTYTCRGKSSDSQFSEDSDPVTLTVSEKPKPQLTSSLEGDVLRGNSVNLSCTLTPKSAGWKFYWSKPTQSSETETETKAETETTSDFKTISLDKVYDSIQYRCRAGRGNQVFTDYSNVLSLTVIEKPKPVVIITPDKEVFRGEKVTFKCEIRSTKNTEWTYSWYKKDYTENPYKETQEFIISSVTDSDSGTYICRGKSSDSQFSEDSDPVTLTVSEKPKPELTSSLKGAVLRGNSVTLSCTLTPQSAGWKFYWSKYTQSSETEAEDETTSDSYTFSSDKVYDGIQYWCRAGRGNQVFTDYSNVLSLTVIESPKPTVTINPDTQVFIGETVTFRCDVQKGRDTEWTYDWFRDSNTLYPYSTTKEFSIRSVTDSHRGQYTCRGRRTSDSQMSQMSDSVTLSVSRKPKPTVIVTPQSSVYTGDNVTLSCNLMSTGWKFLWYKGPTWNSQYIGASDTKTHTVRVSNEGQVNYYCKAHRGNYYSEMSKPATITMRARPKPEVKVQPADHGFVFTGENVTFSCEIKTGGSWEYHWFRDNKELGDVKGKKIYKITDVKESHKGVYTCKGTQSSDPQYTETSDAVTLTVSEKPKPELTSDLKGAALTGNSVILSCTLKLQSAGWKFYWIKPTQSSETETETHQYIISSVRVSDGGQYRCRAGRGNPVYYTDYSDVLWVNVTESPKPTVTINPDTQVFMGETVTFKCDVQKGRDTEWTYEWFWDSNAYPYPTTNEFSISYVTVSHRGQYTCRGRRTSDSQMSEMSDPVTLSVSGKPKPTVTVTPQSSVYTGDNVTLSCNLMSTGWKFLWYKGPTWNSQYIGASDTKTHTVRVSYEGRVNYYCIARRGNYYYSERSELATITVTARPKPEVKVQPADHGFVFTGETVTFSCEIKTGGSWEYHWFRDNNELRDVKGKKIYKIFDVKESHKGVYTCKGTQSSDPQYTETSDAVTLTVSEKPKPQLTSSLKGDLLRGNSVTLYCTLTPQFAGWKFYWSKYTQSRWTETAYTETDSYTISSDKVSDGGQYKCRAGRGNPVYYTDYSDELSLTVIESPKPTVTINPDTQVFIYETVTFRCDVEEGRDTEWTYGWFRDSNTLYPYSTTKEFSIRSVTVSHRGQYTCRGRRTSDSQMSQMSDSVTLSVSTKPKPQLTSSLKGAVLTGNSVTLYCTLTPQSAGWKFYWSKYTGRDWTETKSTETDSYTISSVILSDGGHYKCRAGIRNPVYYTDYSDVLWVNVIGESSPVSLIIRPSRTQHFTADSLSLSCEDQSDSTGWTVRRYTHNETSFDCSSVSGSTCNISSLSTSHTGVYWCQSESGGRSNSVNITVHTDVVLDSPVHPVTEGQSLILRCLSRQKPSNSGVNFYKNDSILQNQTTGEMIISSVSKSDEGFYHCKHPERGESPKSWVSVRNGKAPTSVLKLLSSVATASLYVLVTIILAVKCYRARAEPDEDNRPYRVIEAETSF
ncbi:immunoglobulin superfamily member 1-like isoform X1 [Tachysurus vachellii]|uniref:immunoglobulin superfamily member 1-like isoform X1 n=1 Tax=Tachysurus vachellii TaxID=175792 RepID=UPI00296B1624|nr:immunoglobulin superfamily member 1-like isoform X1 [Tachysurus vachellii]